MSTPNDDLRRLADELPADLAGEVVDFAEFLRARRGGGLPAGMADEDRAWLDADLAPDLDPYEWGPEGPPPVTPVRYEPGVGFVIEGGRGA